MGYRKKILIGVIILVLAGLAVVSAGAAILSRQLRHHEMVFDTMGHWTDIHTVENRLGPPDREYPTPASTAMWFGRRLPDYEASRITRCLLYKVKIPIFPAFYEYDFDADGRLIAKNTWIAHLH